jgi:hypothetical protein
MDFENLAGLMSRFSRSRSRGFPTISYVSKHSAKTRTEFISSLIRKVGLEMRKFCSIGILSSKAVSSYRLEYNLIYRPNFAPSQLEKSHLHLSCIILLYAFHESFSLKSIYSLNQTKWSPAHMRSTLSRPTSSSGSGRY